MEGTRFRIEFLDQNVVDQLKALPKSAQKMIYKAIKERLEVDPIGIGRPLQYSWKGHRRMRVSYYRVIYRIEVEKKIVILVAIDFRRDIYHE
jgi:mRNA interferase RelE/StbE